jgi:hypothetical protein
MGEDTTTPAANRDSAVTVRATRSANRRFASRYTVPRARNGTLRTPPNR